MPVFFRRLRRLPLLWWLATLALAIGVGAVVATSLSQASAAAARYSNVRPVFVVSHDIAAGTQLSLGDVHTEAWPAAFLPSSPAVSAPDGVTVTVAMVAGEPLVEAKVGASGLSASTAMLQEDQRGIAVEKTSATPALRIGDHVDVLVVSPASGGGTGDTDEAEPAVVVAPSVAVIAVDETSVTLAVRADDATRVTYASTKHLATLTLTRP